MHKKADALYGSGYVGLLPKTRMRGNSTSKLPEASKQLMATIIREDYETHRQKSIFASWSALDIACRDQGLIAPSYETFRHSVHGQAGHSQTLRRMGPRAAYQQEPFYWELELKTPRHGDRPFEIAHVDHTELDVELVCSLTGRNLGRPWLSLLTDAFSRRVLAFTLSFDPPSYRACMMIIRECVGRHNRLPQIFVPSGDWSGIRQRLFRDDLGKIRMHQEEPAACKGTLWLSCRAPIRYLQLSVYPQPARQHSDHRQVNQAARASTPSANPYGTRRFARSAGMLSLRDFCISLDHPALGQSPADAVQTEMMNTVSGHGAASAMVVNFW